MATAFLGIDPGASGGMAAINDSGSVVSVIKLASTECDIAAWIRDASRYDRAFAVIERVSSSPQMGVVSAFTFGRSYGFLRGCLASSRVPFVDITPAKWQAAMRCLTKGDKNITKAMAQQLHPNIGVKVTHAIADAILLATYCYSIHKEPF